MLAWILLAGALLCLIYFVVIIGYAGAGTSYVALWLLMAVFLGVSAAATYRCQKYPERVPLRLPVTLITLCAAGVVILLVLQILIFGCVPSVAEPDLEYVIVLGAQVRADGLSKSLKLRLDKAAEYAAENPGTILILSGGQGAREPQTEASAMEAYLLGLGIPKRQLLLEEQSASTVENIAYSRLMIQGRRLEEYKKVLPDMGAAGMERPLRIGILTSNFHLFRAMKIAQRQGIFEVRGIAAPSDPVLLVHLAFRDALAVLKDRLAGNL